VFKKIGLFENKGSLEGWIRKIVYRCMADYFRKNAQYRHFLNLEDHDQPVPACGLDSFFEADILGAVKTLPPVSQAVFRLFALEGYSHAEIASNLNISEGTSKWHLSTAREKLRVLIAPNGDLKQKKV
jgi:RNA polymerase sigma-70 factor (ECF subfamily)